MILLVLHDVSANKTYWLLKLKLKLSIKTLENKSVLKTVKIHNGALHVSQKITLNKLWRHYFMCVLLCDGRFRDN